jgi:hypothetical protein
MKSGRCLYAGAVVLALVVGLGLWKPLHVKADHDRAPRFRVDPFWPKPLPAPVGADGIAHRWVQGEVAGSCTDQWDNVYTFNRGWEVGVTVNGVLQGNQSGAIVGNDATPAKAIPSPPIVAFNPEGHVIAGFGNPTLQQTGPSYGYPTYLPHGAHGCFVDYQGNLWVGGNGDGVVQKYNPQTAAGQGASATYITQIGTRGDCDGTPTNANPYSSCNETNSTNSSHTKLNEPPDMAVDPYPDPVTGTRGSVYIADGYGNHRVVVFTTTDGVNYTYNRQFGTDCGHNETPNGTPTVSNPCPDGTFGHTGGGHPHCVVLANDGLVYACDRPNSRIQAFTKTGTWVKTIRVNNFPSAAPAKATAILFAGNRACDMDFYPNVDYLAGKSPTHQKYIVNVDLQSDNTYLMERDGEVLSAFGRCGIAPCPGHNAGEFAYNHTANVDSEGNVYIAETITGRRIQKFVRVDDDDHHHH